LLVLGGVSVAATAIPASETASPWSPFRQRVFLVIWLAVLVSSTGTWIRDVASGWLMTELSPSPLLVSLVQAATTLPVFLLSLPAGALADIMDRRRLLIGVQLMLMAVAFALTILAYLGQMTPLLLLLLILAGGAGAAVAGPAFHAIVPELVPKADIRPAVALNSLGINVARAIGPALGGLLIASAGLAAAYLLDALSYVLVIAAFLWWRRAATPTDLPPEAFGSAIRTGLRYAARSPDLKRVLARAIAFFLFASAYWALLPLIARERLQADAGYYGLLMACIGAGAVTGALLLPRLRLGTGRLVLAGSLVTAAAIALLAATTSRWLAPAVLFLAGAAWIGVLTSFNVIAQSVLPNWVRARGLAVFLMTFYGAMTAGSALWGTVAQVHSIEVALYVAAAAGTVVALLMAVLVRFPAEGADLDPANAWPEPASAGTIAGERGPVMISIAYRVDPADRRAFLDAINRLAAVRRRDGGFGWRVLEDAEHPDRFEEIFFAASWLEHLRQHRRLTQADLALQQDVRRWHRGETGPVVRHLLAARPGDLGPPQPVGDHRH
jgi:MFS family permease